jgi:tRNA threonylcarbamoyl adenosine modification protein YeaZ
MKILGIDTSTKYLSVALIEDNDVLVAIDIKKELQHSTLLIPTIDKTLGKCNLKLKNVDAIALSIGPGSFTGLRIGVAACKAFNMALGISIIAVPTLDAIAYNFIEEEGELLCPLLDAKKEKAYACFYEKTGLEGVSLKRLSDYLLLDIDSVLGKIKRPTLIFGDGIGLYAGHLRKNRYAEISTKEWYPKADIVAKLALPRAQKKEFTNPDGLVPMYLHSKWCQVK